MKSFVLLAGSAHRPLANKIARILKTKLGLVEIESFPNREIRIRVLADVKGKVVFIIQPTNHKVNDSIVELALLADAIKRKGAKRIVAITPWFGYSPQDKVFREGEPLSSHVVIRMLESAPIDEFVVVDIHAERVLEMFTKKVTHLSAMSVFVDYFKGKLKGNWSSVALDSGAVERAKLFAQELSLPLVKFEKTRDRKTGEVTFHALEGSVKGMNVISFDDFVSTGGTRIKGCDFLKNEGALTYYDCVTHLIVPESTKKLQASGIDKMFITDSLYLDPDLRFNRLKVLSIASLLANHILRY